MFDVAVIGAGPAGCAVAKRCAEHGLRAVILEKKRLPRDKVCSGIIIGPLAHTLIKQEFGEIPGTVLSQPPYLNGYLFHIPDSDNQVSWRQDFIIPLTFRRNLDYWMTEKAEARGVQVIQGAKVKAVMQRGPGFLIQYEKDQENLIGAILFLSSDESDFMTGKPW